MCNSVPIKANEGKLYLRILTSIMSIATAVSKKKEMPTPLSQHYLNRVPRRKKTPKKTGGRNGSLGVCD